MLRAAWTKADIGRRCLRPFPSSGLKEWFKETGCTVSLRSVESLDQSQKSEGARSNTRH
jgi:hypothetical protein